MNFVKSISNAFELARNGEPLHTVGLGVVLPITNPVQADLGMEIFRLFRAADNVLDRKGNLPNKATTGLNNLSAVIYEYDQDLSTLIDGGLAALAREQALRANWHELTAEEVREANINNVWPYQRLAAKLLFNTFIRDVDFYDPFKDLANTMQVGDNLRDIGEDILNDQPIIFDKYIYGSLIRRNKKNEPYISYFGLMGAHAKNISSAFVAMVRTGRLDNFNYPMSKFWAFTSFSKVVFDAIGTFISPKTAIDIFRADRKLKRENLVD